MSRVEWTRLEGNDVEAVVAMCVNRLRPNSTRITPSRGDGGVDILDRDTPVGDVVLQVKRYCEPLDSTQKRDVEASFERLLSDPRWSDLQIGEWHLVTPWDPTPEAEHWLHELGQTHQVRAVWDGLTTADEYAAKFSDVVDYYLHGGSARVQQAYEQMSALFAVDAQVEPLDVQGVSTRVQRALDVLDHDPHYVYEMRFGFGEPPDPSTNERPGLVMTFIRCDQRTDKWAAVDIIARCQASVTARPITLKGSIVAEADSEFRQQFEDSLTYGTGFVTPEGAATIEIDAPGGLGGSFSAGTLWARPIAASETEALLRAEILDPDGRVLATVHFRRTEHTQGQGGIRVLLTEEHNVFTWEIRVQTADLRGSRTVTLGVITGQPVRVVAEAMRFLDELHEPNVLRLSERHGPSSTGTTDSEATKQRPERNAFWDRVSQTRRIADSLDTLQGGASTVIRMPDLQAAAKSDIANWQRAARMINGEDQVATYPENHSVNLILDSSIAPPTEDFWTQIPFTVQVGDQEADLGHCYAGFEDPTIVRTSELEDGSTFVELTTSDRKVTWRYSQPFTDTEAPGSLQAPDPTPSA